jgi:hypothetical protein
LSIGLSDQPRIHDIYPLLYIASLPRLTQNRRLSASKYRGRPFSPGPCGNSEISVLYIPPQKRKKGQKSRKEKNCCITAPFLKINEFPEYVSFHLPEKFKINKIKGGKM